jgi:predicted DNA-binding transcriptional regulator AlpA
MIISESTYAIIQTAVSADPNLTDQQKQDLVKGIASLVSGKTRKPRMGTRKEAMEILGISRPTIGRWIKKGIITPIYLSPSKVRFDLNEIEWYAEHGSRSDS